MTNRDYLNTLSNDKFTDLIIKKMEDFEYEYFDNVDIKTFFEEWLEQEHKE